MYMKCDFYSYVCAVEYVDLMFLSTIYLLLYLLVIKLFVSCTRILLWVLENMWRVKGLHGQIELQNTGVGDALVSLHFYDSSFTNSSKWVSFHEQKQYLSVNVLIQTQYIAVFVLSISSCTWDHIASILTAHLNNRISRYYFLCR